MLSPKNRMRHSTEFNAVMRSGRRSDRGALGVVYLAPKSTIEAEPDPPRVGFIVSKAVGGAVVRNRVQRRLRHMMRPRLVDLPNGSLLVVRAKPNATTARAEELDAQLESAIASVMRPKSASRRRRVGRAEESRRPDAAGERWAGR